MNEENVVFIYNGILFSHKEQTIIVYRQMDGTGEHHLK
jgi:hypothetical protein